MYTARMLGMLLGGPRGPGSPVATAVGEPSIIRNELYRRVRISQLLLGDMKPEGRERSHGNAGVRAGPSGPSRAKHSP